MRRRIKFKKCIDCDVKKPICDFHLRKDALDGYRNNCKKCVIRCITNWRQSNLEHCRKRDAARYRSKPRYFQKINRAWYNKNKKTVIINLKKWRRANPELFLAQVKRWRAKNPEKFKNIARMRRARKRQATGRHTWDDVNRMFFRQKGRCAASLCNVSIIKGYHVDHKTPLSRGGSNWPRNLQLLCAKCNIDKGAKTMKEWQHATA